MQTHTTHSHTTQIHTHSHPPTHTHTHIISCTPVFYQKSMYDVQIGCLVLNTEYVFKVAKFFIALSSNSIYRLLHTQSQIHLKCDLSGLKKYPVVKAGGGGGSSGRCKADRGLFSRNRGIYSCIRQGKDRWVQFFSVECGWPVTG